MCDAVGVVYRRAHQRLTGASPRCVLRANTLTERAAGAKYLHMGVEMRSHVAAKIGPAVNMAAPNFAYNHTQVHHQTLGPLAFYFAKNLATTTRKSPGGLPWDRHYIAPSPHVQEADSRRTAHQIMRLNDLQAGRLVDARGVLLAT